MSYAAVLGEHGKYQACKQHEIAGVGDGNAVWVIGDEQHCALTIGIVRRLIEPIVRKLADVVHRDAILFFRSIAVNNDMSLVVHHSISARVMDNLKIIETDVEWQSASHTLIVGESCYRFAFSQVQGSFSRRDMSSHCANQDDDEGGVKHHYGKATIDLLPDKIQH